MVLKKGEKPKYEWRYSFTKRSEGGMGAPDRSIIKELNRIDGIRARREYSPYVGNTGFGLYGRNKKAMQKAFKILKDYMFVDKISDELKSMSRYKEVRDMDIIDKTYG